MNLPQNILDLMQRLKQMTIENGCTPSEAEKAAEKLNQLLQAHQLSVSDLDAKELGEDIEQVNIRHTGRKGEPARWRRATIQYAIKIGQSFNCAVIFSAYSITYIGTESDVAVARFFFETTWQVIREEGKRQGRERGYAHIHLILFYEQFLMGAGLAIYRRLSKPAQNPTAEDKQVAALVPLKELRIDEFKKREYPDLVDDKWKWRKGDGVAEGYEYGRKMDLKRGVGDRQAVGALPAARGNQS